MHSNNSTSIHPSLIVSGSQNLKIDSAYFDSYATPIQPKLELKTTNESIDHPIHLKNRKQYVDNVDRSNVSSLCKFWEQFAPEIDLNEKRVIDHDCDMVGMTVLCIDDYFKSVR